MMALALLPTVALALLPSARSPSMRAPTPTTHNSRVGLVRMGDIDDASQAGWESNLRKGMASHNINQVQFGPAAHVMREIDLHQAWVLLFNPCAPDEGVYTLQGQKRQNSHRFLVAFANHDDAARFGSLLEAQNFDTAEPTCWSKHDVLNFCAAASFDFAYVPSGALLLPPTQNVYDDKAFHDFGLRLKQAQQLEMQPAGQAIDEEDAEMRGWLESLLMSDIYQAERIHLESCLDKPDGFPAA